MIIDENFNDIVYNYQIVINNYTNFFYNNILVDLEKKSNKLIS